MEMLYNFGIVSQQMYNNYTANNCSVQWVWFYIHNQKPLPGLVCRELFVFAAEKLIF
jgi:hypothetical protein